jgi:hypothetical protein
VVLVTYLGLVLGGIPLVQASRGSVVYVLYVIGLTVALVVTCWLTGEPPGWRSGDRDG